MHEAAECGGLAFSAFSARELASRVVLMIHRGEGERGSGRAGERASGLARWVVACRSRPVVGARPPPSLPGGTHTRCTGATATGSSDVRPEPLEKGCRHIHVAVRGVTRSTTTIARLLLLRLGSSEARSDALHSQFPVRRLLVILRVDTYPVKFSRGERRCFEREESICMCFLPPHTNLPKPLTFECIERC